MGCKESPTEVEVYTSADALLQMQNTLNDPNLSQGQHLNDYWYHLNDEGVEAKFLYYNSYLTRGANTINSPASLNPYLDTLNFSTFPYYTVPIQGESELDTTISYILSLTPENVANYSTLYPLDETNTSTQNWCKPAK